MTPIMNSRMSLSLSLTHSTYLPDSCRLVFGVGTCIMSSTQVIPLDTAITGVGTATVKAYTGSGGATYPSGQASPFIVHALELFLEHCSLNPLIVARAPLPSFVGTLTVTSTSSGTIVSGMIISDSYLAGTVTLTSCSAAVLAGGTRTCTMTSTLGVPQVRHSPTTRLPTPSQPTLGPL